MRTTWNKSIQGRKVVLVPYRRCHVQKYHEWMRSEELQQLTGSEPLTLEQEYEMQQTWLESEDKCTFIVLCKERLSQQDGDDEDEVRAMVGDTNLFLMGDGTRTAEAEIMIADKSCRGQRMGLEAMCLMLLFGIVELEIETFEAKIKYGNEPSIGMFKKLGFAERSRSDVFKEVCLSVAATDESFRSRLFEETEGSVVEEYCHK